MAVKLLIAAASAKKEGKSLGELTAKLAPAVDECERRIKISGEDFQKVGADVLSAFEKRAAQKGYRVVPDSCEGVRLSFDDGWALLRMSLHDPLLPLNVESTREGGCVELLGRVKELISDFEQLDLSLL